MQNILLNKNTIIAVVGVSDNPEKYGYKIFFDLLNKGYNVYAINKAGGNVKNITRYKNISELPEKPDIVDIVVPPKIAIEVVKQCFKLGVNTIWLQPGSESNEIINFCKKNNINCVYNMCIMLKTNN